MKGSRNLRELAGVGIGCLTKDQANKFLSVLVDYYAPNGDKKLGTIIKVTSDTYTVNDYLTCVDITYRFLDSPDS